MATDKKVQNVKELSEKVQKAKSIVFAQYKGIKHKQLEGLRKTLKTVDAELVVAKNRLLARALGDAAGGVQESLQHDTAAVFSYKDEVSGLRELVKFMGVIGLGKTKAGLLGTRALSQEEVTQLSKLPSKDVLLGNLVRQLNAPIQGLHYALSWNINKLVWALGSVREKKG